MSFDRAQLANLVTRGPVTRILIAEHKGSSPRATGTAMLVTPTQAIGTIGGGALELHAITQARKMKPGDSPILSTIPLGPELGQCCGGVVRLVFECFDQNNLPEEGAFFARSLDGSPPNFPVRNLIKRYRNAQAEPKPQLIGGWLIEPMQTAPRTIWLYGAGHVGRAIVQTLDGLPFRVTWVDTHQNRFPDAVPEFVAPLVATNPADAVKYAPPEAEHLVMTYSHELDLNLCDAILHQPHASLGLIGSETKIARFRSRLRSRGHVPAQITSIICPIGDPALGKEPKSIAIGVVRALLFAPAQQIGAQREKQA